jgi:hypothetical protein
MASGKSNYLNNKILNYIFNGTAYASPSASLWCALYTVAPSASTGGTECSGAAYARVQVSSFTTASAASLSNSAAIIFPTASANYSAPVVAAAFCDASTVGNILYWGTLTSSVTVSNGNTFEFLANGFTITEA